MTPSVMARAFALIAVVLAAFLYGIAAGRYELPPFAALKSVKQAFVGTASSSPSSGSSANERAASADVVMLGDSLTARGPWNELSPAGLRNEGIDGDTSLGVLNRLNSIARARPRRVFLMIGINDLIRDVPVETIAERISLIVLTLRTNGVVPVVQSVLHVAERETEINRQVTMLNAALRRWCEAEGIAFLDLNSRLSANDALLPQYSTDGLHLNAQAYAVWGTALRTLMQPSTRAGE